MEVVALVLALVGFALAGWLWARSSKQAQAAATEKQELENELAKARERSKAADAKAKAADHRSRALEKELAEALARRDEKAMALALWELELERSYRQWRDVIVPTDSARAIREENAGQQLAFAISQEVERLREEVGVAIRFDGGLDLPMEAEVALGALRICEELLALAAKKSDEVVVSLDQGDEPSVVIVLHCQGWDDAGSAGTGVLEQDLERMAQRLDGWLKWDRGSDDHVRSTLRLPAPTPTSTPAPLTPSR